MLTSSKKFIGCSVGLNSLEDNLKEMSGDLGYDRVYKLVRNKLGDNIKLIVYVSDGSDDQTVIINPKTSITICRYSYKYWGLTCDSDTMIIYDAYHEFKDILDDYIKVLGEPRISSGYKLYFDRFLNMAGLSNYSYNRLVSTLQSGVFVDDISGWNEQLCKLICEHLKRHEKAYKMLDSNEYDEYVSYLY